MWPINKQIDDFTHPTRKKNVRLRPDQMMNHQKINYPITWSGDIAGEELIIIQKGPSSFSENDFIFEKLPDEFIFEKTTLIKWIDDYLRILD